MLISRGDPVCEKGGNKKKKKKARGGSKDSLAPFKYPPPNSLLSVGRKGRTKSAPLGQPRETGGSSYLEKTGGSTRPGAGAYAWIAKAVLERDNKNRLIDTKLASTDEKNASPSGGGPPNTRHNKRKSTGHTHQGN